MGMTIHVKRNGKVADVQEDFSKAYPFLKLEFYPPTKEKVAKRLQQRLKRSTPLRLAGVHREGEIRIADGMTVGELENIFRERFGANVQVSRHSGSVWLETTMTDKWTLKQQNDHGRELSYPLKKIPGDEELDYD
jgi:hypothetical protein